MRLNRTALIAGAAGLFLAGLAVAQTVLVPLVSIINPSDVMQIIPLGQPQAGNFYANPNQITAQNGYYKSAPAVTNWVYYARATDTFVNFAPSTTAAAVSSRTYLYLPATPSDGMRMCVANSSSNFMTAFTVLSSNSSATVNGSPTQMGTTGTNTNSTLANSVYCWLYSLSNTTWDRQ